VNTVDILVVGLGAVGSALLLQLARRGVAVVGIDRFDPPHDQGSSHGRTRLTRIAVGEGEAFVPLVQRSHQLWRRFEAETGAPLMRQTGLLLVSGHGRDAAAYHSQTASDAFYDFPRVDGQAGVKVATEQLQEDCDPDPVNRHIPDSDVADLSSAMCAGAWPLSSRVRWPAPAASTR
jgi:glycine/D-amino acid oxidase-like deaminating enzyme